MRKLLSLALMSMVNCYASEELTGTSSSIISGAHFVGNASNASTRNCSVNVSNITEIFMAQEEVRIREELSRIQDIQEKIKRLEELTDEENELLKRMGKLVFFKATRRSTIP